LTIKNQEPRKYTFTVVGVDAETVVAHRPDCPDVDKARQEGLPLMTCVDAQKRPEAIGIPHHHCYP
jgi:hypothetical protein